MSSNLTASAITLKMLHGTLLGQFGTTSGDMFFFVDESGHTGKNLFDEEQPTLYYGVLGAKTNLDILAEPYVKEARRRLGVTDRLHANQLGMGGLVKIADLLWAIQKKYQPHFDIYGVKKPDHAMICFFDQVFDQGLNPAVTWTGYWSPLRYILLMKVAYLFDEETLKLAWKARIEINDAVAQRDLITVCQTILNRIPHLPDARSRQIVGDALAWAIKNPDKISYNCTSKHDVLTVTPNIIGFQSVMHGIAARIQSPKGARRIVVDQQSQFNKAQKTLAEFYDSARHVPWKMGPGMPQMNLSNIPAVPIEFCSSANSVGLELVDIYLWIFKRVMEQKELPPELFPIIKSQWHRGRCDEISLRALKDRWGKWLSELPDPTEEQMIAAKELIALDEARRQHAVATLTDNSSK